MGKKIKSSINNYLDKNHKNVVSDLIVYGYHTFDEITIFKNKRRIEN